jgi:hypothetical protein
MSNLSELLPAGGAAKEFEVVASGTLPNGKPVVLKADGTVEVVAPLTVSTSIPTGSETTFYSANVANTVVAFDPNDSGKFVVIYTASATYPWASYAIVGTVSGTSISFGTAVAMTSDESAWHSIAFDPNTAGKFIVVYRGTSALGYSVVGTVSGTSVSFGTAVVYNNAVTVWMELAFDPFNAGKFVVAFKDGGNSNYGKAIVGTMSGTSLTYGSEYTFNSGTTDWMSVAFDSNTENSFVVAYMDRGNSLYATACVGIISGTTISFGSEHIFNSSGSYNTYVRFNPSTAGQFVVAYKDNSAEAVVGTVSGTSISFGTKVAFASSSGTPTLNFDPNIANTFVVAYENSSSYATAIVGTVSGTSLSFGTAYVINAGSSQHIMVSVDPLNAGRFVVVYRDYASGGIGNSRLGQVGYTGTNLTATNFAGTATAAFTNGQTATIVPQGGVSTNQTSLTIGSTYYVQPAGTLATSAGTPSVVAGKAISATSLILKGNS